MFYLDETLLNYQKALDAISSTDLNYLGVTMTVKKTNSGRRVFVSSLGENLAFDNLPLTSASSGMQSSVALHFITNYFSHHYDIVEAMNSTVVKFLAAGDNLSKFSTSSDIGSFPHRKISVHLEEPELSLFPSNQWGLMKYLVGECLTAEKAEMDLTVATHSPYILTAINIMMLAKKASMRDEKRFLALNLPIPLLDTDKVGAWSVAEGKCTSLFDPELGMIDGTFLDHVSDEYEDLILRLNDIIYE